MSKTIIRRYSIPFKKQVVSEYESGVSLTQLTQKYGIGARQTIQRWIKQYGREGLRHYLVTIQQPEERQKVKELEAQIANLNGLISQLTFDNFMLKRCLEVAEDELGHPIQKKSMTSPKKPSKSKKKRR